MKAKRVLQRVSRRLAIFRSMIKKESRTTSVLCCKDGEKCLTRSGAGTSEEDLVVLGDMEAFSEAGDQDAKSLSNRS